MIARGKKGLAKTMWVKNVPFNMVSVSGGRIRYVDNTNIMSWKELYGSYLIGETEVTEEFWCAVMNGNKNSSQLPAMASFEEWSQFIIQLNKLTGKKYKIPSWGEWFNAAQDGNEFSGSANIGEVAWYGGNANDIQDVAQKKANKHGLFDMSGNAWEFLENGYCAGGSFAHGYTTVKRTDICRIDEGHTYSLKNVKAGLRLVLKIER